MFGFIAKHRRIWPLAWLRAQCIAEWFLRLALATAAEARKGRRDDRAQVRLLQSDRTYGARRVWHDVLADGVSCGLHRIERLIRAQALKARPRRQRLPPDTGDRIAGAIAPDILDRRFKATAPNQKWTADFTYIWTDEGWLYVAVRD